MPESPMTMVISVPQSKRRISLEIGKEYVIGPSSDHDGRRATLIEVMPYHPDKPDDLVARVKFSDDHRYGRVELDDLWEVGQIPEKPKKRENKPSLDPQPLPYQKPRFNKSSSNQRQSINRKYRP